METVSVYESNSGEYETAFQAFLDNTDQKRKAREFLDGLVSALPMRRLLVDVGAGNGELAAPYIDQFDRTVLVEPSPHLRQQLAERFDGVDIRDDLLPNVTIGEGPADCVLCSHVLYYVPREHWLASLESMSEWIDKHGVVIVILQQSTTDIQKMLEHFLGDHCNLRAVAEEFGGMHAAEYSVTVDPIDSAITTADKSTAYTIAEFMLNLTLMTKPPGRAEFEEYVENHFRTSDGGYRITCSQDVVQIRCAGN